MNTQPNGMDEVESRSWQEHVARAPGRVERAAGLIHDVKVVGFRSANGRTYAREALERAVPLYEGAKVFVNHAPAEAIAENRGYEERIGALERVRPAEDGLRAELRINPKHPLAAALLWDAEHAPEAVGLSHHAEGRGRIDADGHFVVEEITRVRSVDLVVNPATSRGLFESSRHVERLETELRELRRRDAAGRREREIEEALRTAELPPAAVGETFREILRAAPDGTVLRAWLEDRAEVWRLARGAADPISSLPPALPRDGAELASRLRS